MATVQPHAQSLRSLQDAEVKIRLQELRRTDNTTNLYYLVRTYGYLAVVIAASVWFFHFQASAGISLAWNVPVAAIQSGRATNWREPKKEYSAMTM